MGNPLNRRDIIVIGASAGGATALIQLVSQFPPDLRASVFVVVHLPTGPSNLSEILSRSCPLPAIEAVQGQLIEPGTIYVAPPDRHLLIENGRNLVWNGPKESRHRPAINPLFRSAAAGYGERVVGIVLSGILEDGTTGLWWIHRYGGITVVQDPFEAEFDQMPQTALKHVQIDYVLGVSKMGPLLVDLTNGRRPVMELDRFTGT